MTDVEAVISLAKEIGKEDPIDFGYLTIDEDSAYNVLALGLMEKYTELQDGHDKQLIMLASWLHLLVENMVLNLRLMERGK